MQVDLSQQGALMLKVAGSRREDAASMVKRLLAMGVAPNIADASGFTALAGSAGGGPHSKTAPPADDAAKVRPRQAPGAGQPAPLGARAQSAEAQLRGGAAGRSSWQAARPARARASAPSAPVLQRGSARLQP